MKPIVLLPYAGTAVGGSYVSSAQVAGYIQQNFAYECRVLLPEQGRNDDLFRRVGLTPHYYRLGDGQITRLYQTRGVGPKLAALPAHLLMLKTAVSEIRHHQPDLVHINDSRSLLAWALAARYWRIPVLWQVRGAEGNNYLDRVRLKLSDYLIFVSDAIRERFGQVALPPNITAYNAVNFDRFHPPSERAVAKKSLGLKPSVVTLGQVANLLWYKRPEWAVQTVIDLCQAGHEVVFVHCGADPTQGEYERRLRQMITESGLDNYFHFLGYCAEVEKVMQALDILLLTSTAKGEAFPRVAIEAMACGTAVLTTRCGGVAEAIENGRNGIIVDADDYPALLSAAEQLVIEPDYRRQLAETAVTTVRARFSLSQISQQVAQVYEYLLRH
jgi:D-inositol-3-phosphate glycosyltransferase